MRTQISAEVSEETKRLLEKYVASTGIKKGHMVEQAIRNYLRALDELPADIIVPAKIVVSKESGVLIRKRLKDAKPSAALRKLMKRHGNQIASSR